MSPIVVIPAALVAVLIPRSPSGTSRCRPSREGLAGGRRRALAPTHARPRPAGRSGWRWSSPEPRSCVGIAGAFLVTRTDLPGRRVWRVVLALPLSLPSYVTAFAWISWRPSLAGFWSAALVLTSVSYPFVYLPVASGPAPPRRHPRGGRPVARAHAHPGRLRPDAAPGDAGGHAGTLLVALYVLADFGAVATMRFESFTWVDLRRVPGRVQPHARRGARRWC